MKEYLKMSDAFNEQVMPRNSTNGLTLILHGNKAVHGSHAICVHDELVAEVERLRSLCDWFAFFCEEVGDFMGTGRDANQYRNAYEEYKKEKGL